MRALYLAPFITLAGCFHPAPQAGAPCNERGECPSGLRCIADLCQSPDTVPDDGAVDVAIDVCPELSCLGGDLAGCNSRMTCSLGCADAVGSTPAHCMQMVPSIGITPALLAGATADVSDIDLSFDTETGEININATVIRGPGTGVIAGINFTVIANVGVFSAHSWNALPITDSADDWDASGTNSLALYAATTITFAGTFDVGAEGSTSGPGGANGGTSGSSGPTCRGKAGLWQSAGFGEGGGGAGGRTAGGNGAVSNLTTFGVGGPQCSTGPTTIPLVGGNGGGAGGVETATTPDTIHGGDGGGGGGGLALVAMESITIMSSGVVGSPGDGGESVTTAGDGGGGGGGGGAVLIEAPVVTIMGKVTANGGGGAAPSGGADGSRGHLNDGSAAGAGVFMTGSGGRGGTGTAAPMPGTNFTDLTTSRGGGGGGAAGRMEIKSRSRVTTGSVMSPGPALTDISTQ
jgi:hypothetical protein